MYRKVEKKHFIRKADIILTGICLAMAAFLAIFFLIIRDGDERQLLRVSFDGEILETLELNGNTLQEGHGYYLFLYENDSVMWEKSEEYPNIPEGVSFNLLCISPGEIRMEAADCRDQICVNHMPISDGGESIICLPHRLVAEIVGGRNEETPDGMVK